VKKLSLISILIIALAAGFAQTAIPFEATYTFGADGNVTSFAYNGTQYPGISMGDMIKSDFINSVDSENNFRATNWNTKNTLDPRKYIGFTISAVPGYKFSVNTVEFGIGKDADGPTGAHWRGEVNNSNSIKLTNYTTQNAGLSVSNGNLTMPAGVGSWTGNVVTLAGNNDFTHMGECTFKMHTWSAVSAAGIAGLDGPITITGTYTFSGTHPAIEVSPTSLTGFTYEQGSGSSTVQSFTVSGAGLGANESILLTAPNGYGLSLTEAGPYYATSGVAADGSGNVASTTVYVRLNEGLPAGEYSGNVEASYSNVTRNVYLSGTVTDPTLPVTLSHFSATLTAQNNVQLTWISQSESNLMGYNVYRSTNGELSSAMQICPMIAGTNTSMAQTYTYNDKELVEDGTYYYWLQSVDLDGTTGFHGPVSVVFSINGDEGAPSIPTATKLDNAYPNPFNPNTTIRYQLKDPGKVKIDIYNLKGHPVRSFSRCHDAAGRYSIVWDGCDSSGNALPSGVYLYKMSSGSYSAIKKLVLQK
jgi:hypothetical protein